MTWSEEREARLRELWPDPDLSCAAIGAELGVSRSAVIGKANRLGLGPKPHTAKPPRVRKPKPSTLGNVWGPFPRLKPEPFIPRAIEAPPSRGKSILRLARNDCRWATHEDEKTGQHRFCGHPSANGRPYCEAHCLLVYVPRERREAGDRRRRYQRSRYRSETTSWMVEEVA